HQYYAAHGGISENQWYDGLAAIINQPHLFGDLPDKLRAVLGADWQNKLPLVSYHGTVYPERVLPTVLLSSTPTGVRGLIIVAMLAAAMSTFNSTVNVATSFFTRDLYQGYLRRRAGTRELIYVSWLFGALVFAVSFWMAFYAQTINDIWSWITSGLVAGTGAAYFLRWYWWRFNGGGFAASMLAGLVAAVLQRTFFPQLDEFSQFVYILAISLTASIAGTYLTPPTDHEVLKNFYCRTMPFGFWKPYSSLLPAATRQALAREHRNDILAIPFGLAWVTTLNLIPLQLMVKEWLSAAVSAVIFIISLIGLYYFWYRHLAPPGTLRTVDGPKPAAGDTPPASRTTP
ncbi:MAG: sodium:solute symporter, partial [Negativicutes bacterium]|nr:sodium:solute symporter [Negativicutes bacterium]